MEIESPPTATIRHAALIFCVSASVLGYEIVLMRLLSIGQWHHFAAMVISMALLGFGASGSFLFLFYEKIRADLDLTLTFLAAATALSYPLAFSLSQKVGLDPLLLVWLPGEWLKILLSTLLMGLPFFLAGGIVGVILTGAGERAPRMYAADLIGAGAGAIAVVPALYLDPPWALLPALGGLVLVGGACHCAGFKNRKAGAAALFLSAGMILLAFFLLPPVPAIHHTKGLPMTLALPDARIEAKRAGPLGMIHVVGSHLIRHFPGLSLQFTPPEEENQSGLPEQKALFVDADALSPITRFSGDLRPLAPLDYTTIALPYFLRRPGKILVAGAGGGMDLLLALRHKTSSITALEANRQIADLLSGPFAEFSGYLFSRQGVHLKVREARQFLQSGRDPYDLIQFSLLDAFGASTGGLYAASENYLYTSEAFVHYLKRLKGEGMLALTRWLKFPPRDALRMVATALAALRKTGLSTQPERHLLLIRSWKTSTLLVSKSPFTPDEILRAARFCEERGFDLVYYAGMGPEQANRFDILEAPVYYQGASRLSGPEAADFIEDYLFDISPTTDDRPYFSHFFRWDKAGVLLRHLRGESLSLLELGFFFILATLLQALVAGGLLIIFPLFFLRRMEKRKSCIMKATPFSGIPRALLYFASIGLAFMFLEMALLPKYTLLLSHPVYAAAIVLSGILIFAGWGSLSLGRFHAGGGRFIWVPVVVILCWVGLQALMGDHLIDIAMAWDFEWRVLVAVLFLAPLSFFLGWPFPAGLTALTQKSAGLAPWAWGVNGCASVTGAVLGKCLAMSIGFRALMFTACGLYLLAALLYPRLIRRHR